MEKIEIKYKPSVEKYLNNLLDILFEEEYFGFIESARNYIRKLLESTEHKIKLHLSKKTPTKLLEYGEFYVSYSPNNKTTWYIFYSKSANRVLVKFITNNHMPEAQYLGHS